MSGITIAYSGVHQAFQLALAAQEIGQLDRFYCSLFDAPGKWGGRLARLVGRDSLMSRRLNGIPGQKVAEFPWPLLRHHLFARMQPRRRNDWVQTNGWFDAWVAKDLRNRPSTLFVGVETCGERSLAVARDLGMKTILDCPGIDAEFLDTLACKAAAEFRIGTSASGNGKAMKERKRAELESADAILVCSDFQARRLRERTESREKLIVTPLWADTEFWHPAVPARAAQAGPLKVLFAGKICIRKGVPYLLEAVRRCAESVELILAGPIDDEVRSLLNDGSGRFRTIPPRTKPELRNLYWECDVLVLPSLGDSFGFVAMEAMACGLPVIVTENCGVPVPDECWRVPVMNADAIAERLLLYGRDRQLCHEHGGVAARFAAQFTPERYREQIKCLFRRLLEDGNQKIGDGRCCSQAKDQKVGDRK